MDDSELNCLKELLENKRITLPPNDLSIGEMLEKIGIIYLNEKGDFEAAVNYLKESFEIFQQSLTSRNQSLRDKLYIIGEIYATHLQMKNEEAFDYFNRLLDKYRITLAQNDPLIGSINEFF